MFFDTYLNTQDPSDGCPYCQAVKNSVDSVTIGFLESALSVNYEKMDAIVNWASQRFVHLTGNALINFPYAPKVVQHIKPEDFEDFLKTRIQETVRRYPQIHSWILFNELFNSQSDSIRVKTSLWDKTRITNPILGVPNYLEKCFLWAIEANPKANYFINDFRPQCTLKWVAIFKIVDSLLDKGIPVHLGIQHHHHLFRAAFDGLFVWGCSRDLVRKARERNMLVHFTENSIWGNSMPGSSSVQSLIYEQLAQCALDEGVRLFNVWSLTDHHDYHWGYLPEDRDAGFLDSEFNPKLVYFAVKKIIAKSRLA
ncbi:MAG TPA: endo-1,4-beta-xylanase [Cyanophyceae cyanobacterium]